MSALTNPALIPPGTAPTQAPAGTRRPTRAGRPGAPGPAGAHGAPGAPGAGRSFAEELTSASQAKPGSELRFSRHALQRVQRRGISLDPTTLGRLSEGVGRAAGKGSRDSVVLVDGTAFVVSVANRTVLTAVPQEHMREQVFTNIDSAVIA